MGAEPARRRWRARRAGAALLGALLAPPPAAAAAADAAGERASLEIAAPAQRLLAAVADWPHYPEFFPFVTRSRVRAEGTGETLVDQVIDPPGPGPARRLTVRAEHGATTGPRGTVRWVRWKAVDGTATQGEWTLTDLGGDRTRVDLFLVLDLGRGRGHRGWAARRTLPWALDGLRQHAGRCRYDRPVHPTCDEEPAYRPGDLPAAP